MRALCPHLRTSPSDIHPPTNTPTLPPITGIQLRYVPTLVSSQCTCLEYDIY